MGVDSSGPPRVPPSYKVLVANPPSTAGFETGLNHGEQRFGAHGGRSSSVGRSISLASKQRCLELEKGKLGGGFKDLLFSPRRLGKIFILTNSF